MCVCVLSFASEKQAKRDKKPSEITSFLLIAAAAAAARGKS